MSSRVEAGEGLLNQGAWIPRPALDSQTAGLDAGEVEEVADQAQHALRRTLDAPDRLRQRSPPRKNAGGQQDRTEGILQVMRHDREELLAHPHRLPGLLVQTGVLRGQRLVPVARRFGMRPIALGSSAAYLGVGSFFLRVLSARDVLPPRAVAIERDRQLIGDRVDEHQVGVVEALSPLQLEDAESRPAADRQGNDNRPAAESLFRPRLTSERRPADLLAQGHGPVRRRADEVCVRGKDVLPLGARRLRRLALRGPDDHLRTVVVRDDQNRAPEGQRSSDDRQGIVDGLLDVLEGCEEAAQLAQVLESLAGGVVRGQPIFRQPVPRRRPSGQRVLKDLRRRGRFSGGLREPCVDRQPMLSPVERRPP